MPLTTPPLYTEEQLRRDARRAASEFERNRRKSERTWADYYSSVFAATVSDMRETLAATDDLRALDSALPALLQGGHLDMLRYLCRP